MSAYYIKIAVPVSPWPEFDQAALHMAYLELEHRSADPIVFVEYWWHSEPEVADWRLLAMQAWTV